MGKCPFIGPGQVIASEGWSEEKRWLEGQNFLNEGASHIDNFPMDLYEMEGAVIEPQAIGYHRDHRLSHCDLLVESGRVSRAASE